MGRIPVRYLRYFAVEDGIVEVPLPDNPDKTRKWKVYNLVLYVDGQRVAVSVPLLPRDQETKRAWAGHVENEVLTALGRLRRLPPQQQLSVSTVVHEIRNRVRQEMPTTAIRSFDYKVKALHDLFPITDEHDLF